MSNFLRSKDIGDAGEKQVLDLFTLFGYNNGKYPDKEYDIWVEFGENHKMWYGEVKNDAMASKTGNFALEYWNVKKNAPSGFMASKAHIWFHLVKGDVWATSLKNLRNFTDMVKPKRIIEVGGDDNASLMLYPLDKIGEVFHKLNDVSKADFTTSLSQILS